MKMILVCPKPRRKKKLQNKNINKIFGQLYEWITGKVFMCLILV